MEQKKFLRDLVATIKGNGLGRYTRIGDFISVKEGENLEIIIDGNTSTVEAGDELELPFVFKELVIRNKSEYEQKIILAVGFGKFRRPQIKGTVTAVTGIIGQDGRTYSDDRITESVNLAITNANAFSYAKDEIIAQTSSSLNHEELGAYYDPIDRCFYAIMESGSSRKVYKVDPKTCDISEADNGLDYYVSIDRPRGLTRDYVFYDDVYTDGGIKVLPRGIAPANRTPVALDMDEDMAAESSVRLRTVVTDDVSGKTFLIFGNPSNPTGNPIGVSEFNGATYTPIKKLQWIGDIGVGTQIHGALRYDEENALILRTSGDKLKFDFDAYTVEKTTSSLALYATAAFSYYNNIHFFANVLDPKYVRAIFNADYKGLGFVSVGECRPLQIFNRDAISKISADVTLTQQGDATVKIEGELIKAILELYAARVGGAVPVNYLDYIYGIKGAGLNTYSGDESFARVGIVDNFTINSPDKIQLYFSKRLLA